MPPREDVPQRLGGLGGEQRIEVLETLRGNKVGSVALSFCDHTYIYHEMGLQTLFINKDGTVNISAVVILTSESCFQ